MTSSIQDRDLAHIWQHTPCYPSLDHARLFMTGATGFFGSWLLESLAYAKRMLNLKIDIVVLTRNQEAFRKKRPHLATMPGLTLLTGDVTDFTFPQGAFTHVVHAATDVSPQGANRLDQLDTIVTGTRHTLNFAIQSGVKKFLLVSSGSVYGTQPPTVSHVNESYLGAPDPLISSSSYGLGKRMAEHLAVLYANQYPLDVSIARCFAFVGPYLPQDAQFAVGNFISNAISNQPIRILGDGTPYRSYLYAADLVIWLWTILCEGRSGVAYNVGSEEAVTLFDLAKVVASVKPTSVVVEKKSDPAILPSRYVPQTLLAQTQLKLKQYVGLKDAIERTIAWSLQQ